MACEVGPIAIGRVGAGEAFTRLVIDPLDELGERHELVGRHIDWDCRHLGPFLGCDAKAGGLHFAILC